MSNKAVSKIPGFGLRIDIDSQNESRREFWHGPTCEGNFDQYEIHSSFVKYKNENQLWYEELSPFSVNRLSDGVANNFFVSRLRDEFDRWLADNKNNILFDFVKTKPNSDRDCVIASKIGEIYKTGAITYDASLLVWVISFRSLDGSLSTERVNGVRLHHAVSQFLDKVHGSDKKKSENRFFDL